MSDRCKIGSWLHENLERARRIAKIREDLHLKHKSHRPLSKGYEVKGAFGEIKFSSVTGLPVDEERRIEGDKGIDFVTRAGPLDVKTASKPGNLIAEVGHVIENCIYVLAGLDRDDVHFQGWHYGFFLARQPVDDGTKPDSLFRNGVFNHYIPRRRLLPMSWLWPIILLLVALALPAQAFDYDTTGSGYSTPTDFEVFLGPNPQRGWCDYGSRIVYQTRDYHSNRGPGTKCFFPSGNNDLPDVRPPAFQSIFRDPEWWEKGEGYRGDNEVDRNQGRRP